MTFPVIMIGAVLSHVAYQAASVVNGFFALAFHFLWIGALFGENGPSFGNCNKLTRAGRRCSLRA